MNHADKRKSAAVTAGLEPTRRPRVTVIGGGTGSFHVLSGLRQCGVWAEVIVTMADSGGDSGELRDAFGVLPPGDVRRCLVALSEESQLLRDLFSFRFNEPPLRGRSFGNLFILALTKVLGSDKEAIEAIGKLLKIRGKVIPVTWDHAHLIAELESGEVVCGEANIDGRGRENEFLLGDRPYVSISRVYLEPGARANPDAIEAIGRSDCVVLAPGDMYTSTIPNLLVQGIPDAIQRSTAPLIYVLNLMTKYGETHGWTASRHVAEIAKYSGRAPDVVLAHKGTVPPGLLVRYQTERAYPVELDLEGLRRESVKLVRTARVALKDSFVRHDPLRTAKALMTLIEELNGQSASNSNS